MAAARTLIALLHYLDAGDKLSHGDTHTEYLVVTRWNPGGEEGGNDDEEATALFRELLRAQLGGFNLDEIGAATLAEIDARASL